ncbi:hypothetical protein Salat_0830800 [Sesamum alatum]|uniref:Uncharacterized protein n=1 Tax=Sesamum alatum TaxID=300844 RepID=A0AAE1YI48_9LAMI|nr:hypothetical protein Salat_0830800 [Sesamum alatum]
MAEHRYISLKDVMKNEANPKFKFKEFESEEGHHEFFQSPKMSRNPKVVLSNPIPSQLSLVGSCSDILGSGEKFLGKEKKGVRTCISLRHSRSDDPLVYRGFDADEDKFNPNEDFEELSRKIMNLSWEERTLNSNLFLESEDVEEKEADDEDDEEEQEEIM